MAKTASLRFGCDDTSTTKVSYSTWLNATKALKGSDFIKRKIKEVKALMVANCDCEDVAMAMLSKSDEIAVKLSQGKGNSEQLQRQARDHTTRNNSRFSICIDYQGRNREKLSKT